MFDVCMNEAGMTVCMISGRVLLHSSHPGNPYIPWTLCVLYCKLPVRPGLTCAAAVGVSQL